MNTVRVIIPTPLRKLTAGANEVEVSATTVGQVVEGLESAHAGFQERVFDETGQVRTFLGLYVNENDIRTMGGLDAPVADGDTVTITMALAGG